jgi:branched-chain amino acid transport system permease protein
VAGAVLLAGLLAWIVGLITTHLRHDYLAIATFGVAIALENFARNAEPITGGAKGLRGFERPLENVINDPFWFNLAYLIFVIVVLIIVYNILENIGQSPFGRLLRAIREDEVAAQSLGKSPARIRLQAFIFGSMIMGLSGALYATFYAFISPQDILPILTFQIWSMLIVGGSGNNKGAVFGTLVVWAGWVGSGWVLTQFAPVEMQLYIGTIQFIMIGLIIVLTLLIRPKGLLPEKLILSRSVARLKPE